MVQWLSSFHPVIQALLGGLMTWLLTAVGAVFVLVALRPSRRLLDTMLGFAGGVMIAASFWSLLAPAIEIAEEMPVPAWLPPAVGFLVGGFVLAAMDKILPHVHPGLSSDQAEGIKTTWHRTTLLIMAITLHNIPEGLAVGVAFGAAATGLGGATVASALALAVGIGIQNVPEGLAVAMPLRRAGLTPLKSFWWGQLSAIVEPAAAVLGAFAVTLARPLLPYVLAFAAGAMIFVVAEELIPEADQEGNIDLATYGLMVGFVAMMILDVAFG
ncbi:MAG: ZIP family metal transporter [Armatimonadetes bacterium]|nr:ZIP family metal transporter [Armatimonadota bacterium]